VLSSGTVAGTATAKVRVYAVNYNVLRVMSGMAGVALTAIITYIQLANMIATRAEKQRATNKQAMFVDNFALTPVLLVCC
jgi:hypothetical protein